MLSIPRILILIVSASYMGNANLDYAMHTEFWTYDELPIYEDGWFGLFETDSGQVIQNISIHLNESSSRPHPDERPEPFYIEFENPLVRPLFIFTSSELHFREGVIDQATFPESNFELGDCFMLRGEAFAYRWLRSTKNGLILTDGEIDQLLTKTCTNYSKGTYISIVWAGDLDRDCELDFIINDIDDSYNRYYHKLFLSSGGGEGDLVGEVASSYDVFY